MALLGKARVIGAAGSLRLGRSCGVKPVNADLIHRRYLRYLIFVYPEYNAEHRKRYYCAYYVNLF